MCSELNLFKIGDRVRLHWDITGHPAYTIGRVLEVIPIAETNDPMAPMVLVGLSNPAAQVWVTQEQVQLGILERLGLNGGEKNVNEMGEL